jgi:hypothetical protein
MDEGWCGDEYLIIFSEAESEERTLEYSLAEYLPGYRVVGIRGWDDFLILSEAGGLFTVPTVPLSSQYIEPYSLPTPLLLEPDERFTGQIKWYVHPVVLGGDPEPGKNVVWLNHEEHWQAVRYWNVFMCSVTLENDNP